MSGQRSQEAKDASAIAQEEARRFQGLAMQYLPQRNAMLYEALDNGGPSMESAFRANRAAIAEQGYQNDRSALQALLAQGKPAAAGGNTSQLLQGTGGRTAEILAANRLNEALAPIEQRTKVLQMLLGQNVNTANQAVQSGAAQLQAIGMQPDYNRALAIGSALGSAGYSVWSQWPRDGFGGGQAVTAPYNNSPGMVTNWSLPAWQGGYGGGGQASTGRRG